MREYDVEAHCRALVDAGLPCMGSKEDKPVFDRELTAEEMRLVRALEYGDSPPPAGSGPDRAHNKKHKPKAK